MMMRKLGFLTLATALMLAACNGAGPEKLPDDNMSEIGNLSENTDIAITPPPVANVTEPSNATAEAAPAGAVTFVSGGTAAALSLAGIIDLGAERARLTREVAAFDSDIGHVMKKLGNPNFVERAAPAVIDEQRAKLAEAEAGKVRLETALARLSALA
jgi:valyl-tRNA synthetase